MVNELNEQARMMGVVGYAQLYLYCREKKSVSEEEIDIQVYKKLVALDTKIGTTASEQLFTCLLHTSRWDIIKV